MGYSLQEPSKQNDGTAHPARGGQFRDLNALAALIVDAWQPMISVATRKNGTDRQLQQRRTRVASQGGNPPERMRTTSRDPKLSEFAK